MTVRLGFWMERPSAPVGAIAGSGERVLSAKGRVRSFISYNRR